MAYTLTGTVSSVKRARESFQGLFSDMWVVKGTIDTGGNGVDGDAATVALTVPGVALGDIVLAFSVDETPNDADGFGFFQAFVSAANTVSVNKLDTTAVITDPWTDANYRMVVVRLAN